MTTAQKLGRAVDTALGIFAPVSALRRSAARSAYYAAAKTTHSTGDWNPVDPTVNLVIANSAPQLRARARQLVRDMPQMATAIRRIKDFTVGTGLVYEPRVLDPVTEKLDRSLNLKIEDAWKFWADEADDAGRLHLYDIQSLCEGQESEVGEYLIVKKLSRDPGRYLPFSLQLFEVDSLAEAGGKASQGNEIHRGVEYDPRTGKVQAYHFQDAERWSRVVRLPASEVLLGYETLRPGQLRGVTPLAPAILLANSLRDYLDAELDAARASARILSWIESPDPAGTMAAFGITRDTTQGEPARRIEELGTLIQQYLKTGEKVTLASPNRPGAGFEAFAKFCLRSFAAIVGVSYELVSGDYSDMQYTTARVSRNDFLAGIRTRRARRIRQFCEPIRREFFQWAVASGKLDLPGYFSNPWPYLRGTWLGPGMEALDPLRENRAHIEAIEAGLESPQENILARGRDPDDVLDEIEEWQSTVAEKGITLGSPSAALATNPAAVAPGTGSGDGQAEEEPDAPAAKKPGRVVRLRS